MRFANARAREYLQSAAPQGHSFWTVLKDAHEQGVERHFAEARASGQVVKFDHHAPGLNRWFSFSIHPLQDGLMLFMRDTAEHSEQDYRSRNLLRFASDGLLLLNADFSQQFHHGPLELQGGAESFGPHLESVPESDRARLRKVADGLPAGISASLRYRYRPTGDKVHWLQATLTNRLADPETRALVINYRDVTAELAAQRAIARREANLEEMRGSLELRLQRLERLHRVASITTLDETGLNDMLKQVVMQVSPLGAVTARVFVKVEEQMRIAADSDPAAFPTGSAADLASNRLAVRAYDAGRTLVLATAREPTTRALDHLGFRQVWAIPFNRSGVRGVTLALVNFKPDRQNDFGQYAETIAGFFTNAVASRHLIGRLERSARDSHALARFGHQLERLTDRDSLVSRALSSLFDQMDLRLIQFAEVKGEQLVPTVVLGPRTEHEQQLALMPLNVNTTLALRTVKDGLPSLIADRTKLRDSQPQLVEFGLHSVMGLPLHGTHGVRQVVLLGHDDESRRFTEAELSVTSLFVQRLASALQRVRYVDEIKGTRDATFRALGRALEYRDYETHGHTDRVTRLTRRFAAALKVPDGKLQGLIWGAYLHDLGKLGIPDHILLKPGRLSSEEFEVVKRHTVYGADMCRDIPFLPRVTHQVVRSHHERWDGSGYPDGLAGAGIPLAARMFALVDVFDALTSERVYKEAWDVGRALEEIESLAGSQFDPQLVQPFVNLMAASR